MKAITLYQPWGSAIAAMLKRYETRSWPVWKYWRDWRGSTMAIHAGKSRQSLDELPIDVELSLLIETAQAEGKLPEVFPLGCVLCTVKVVNCIQMDAPFILKQTAQERTLGDWRVGRYAWEMEVTEVFAKPIPARGEQGLWDWYAA